VYLFSDPPKDFDYSIVKFIFHHGDDTY